uniref:Uncharacterized protein n=1 Tax=Triticum urartu TaxID=4572 RepID=A0A8R7Q4J4_TRIUA
MILVSGPRVAVSGVRRADSRVCRHGRHATARPPNTHRTTAAPPR